MADYNFTVSLGSLLKTEVLRSASREELRVLLALVERGGRASADEIAALAGVSLSRAKAAITLWQEECAISEDKLYLAEDGIYDEFTHDILKDDIVEERSLDVARSIRDNNLASLISECARIMNKEALNTTEIKLVEALYSQLGLSPEYIITLGAYLSSKETLTPKKLSERATSLHKKRIDTLEELEIYIKDKERITGAMWEIHRIFGNGRKPSEREITLYERWTKEYCYGEAIVSEAYSVATMTVERNIKKYMDAVLKSWFDAGCKTVAACQEQESKFSEEFKKNRKKQMYVKSAKAQTPKFADFESESALMLALERSYGSTDKK